MYLLEKCAWKGITERSGLLSPPGGALPLLLDPPFGALRVFSNEPFQLSGPLHKTQITVSLLAPNAQIEGLPRPELRHVFESHIRQHHRILCVTLLHERLTPALGLVVPVELTRFRGHPQTCGGEHDAEEPTAVFAGVPAADGRPGAWGADARTPDSLSREFEPTAHAGDGVGAVLRRSAVAQHLDAFERARRDH